MTGTLPPNAVSPMPPPSSTDLTAPSPDSPSTKDCHARPSIATPTASCEPSTPPTPTKTATNSTPTPPNSTLNSPNFELVVAGLMDQSGEVNHALRLFLRRLRLRPVLAPVTLPGVAEVLDTANLKGSHQQSLVGPEPIRKEPPVHILYHGVQAEVHLVILAGHGQADPGERGARRGTPAARKTGKARTSRPFAGSSGIAWSWSDASPWNC